jgi:MFS family permease
MTRAAPPARWQAPPAVLAGAFLFNLGQGVLRPTLPLYLRTVFAANYRMVTLIPVVFGAGKWVANLPTGYLLDRLGPRRLMVGGLILIALSDVGSAMVSTYGLFLILRGRRRGLGGVQHGRDYHDGAVGGSSALVRPCVPSPEWCSATRERNHG